MNEKIKEALDLAKGIMDYCQGDAWERECTQADREKFDKIYEELFPPQKEKETRAHWEVWCDVCNRRFINDNAYKGHLLGKKHKQNMNIQFYKVEGILHA